MHKPFTDLSMTPDDTVLDINRMVSHATQHQRFVKRTNNKNGVMSLCTTVIMKS
jgi:hypothetical protein